MADRRKYRKGAQVTSIGDAANAIIGQKCLYLNDKCQNWAWLQNMSLVTLWFYVRRGHVWFAVENKEVVNG